MDLKLLKGLLDRVAFDILSSKITTGMLSKTAATCYAWIKAYYASYPDAKGIDTSALKEYVKLRNPGSEDSEGVKITLELISRLDGVGTPDTASLYDALLEVGCAGELGRVVTEYQTGGEVDIIAESAEIVQKYSTLRGIEEDEPDNILDILEDMQENRGITFEGISMLEKYTMPFVGGDSILFAGRPDKGKTTWLAYMIPKGVTSAISTYGVERPILWLVNEGNVNKIVPRIYQGALGVTLSEMYKMKSEGTLIDAFEEVIQAPHDYIKVRPIHGKTIQDVELLVQKYNPCMVVIDMVEHVGGVYGGSKAEVIGATWERLRTLALQYDYVSIGTAQISAEGSDMMYPPYDHISYTRTAVQGYTDVIMMMGSRDVPGMENVRGISMPKNKSKVQGAVSCPRIEFNVDFDTCQWYERADRSNDI